MRPARAARAVLYYPYRELHSAAAGAPATAGTSAEPAAGAAAAAGTSEPAAGAAAAAGTSAEPAAGAAAFAGAPRLDAAALFSLAFVFLNQYESLSLCSTVAYAALPVPAGKGRTVRLTPRA